MNTDGKKKGCGCGSGSASDSTFLSDAQKDQIRRRIEELRAGESIPQRNPLDVADIDQAARRAQMAMPRDSGASDHVRTQGIEQAARRAVQAVPDPSTRSSEAPRTLAGTRVPLPGGESMKAQ